jgi:hypothetical protein
LAIKGLTASIKSFLASNPIGWAVLGISAITGVIYAINKHNKKLEEARQEIIDAGETARSEISQTKSDLEDLTSSATDAIETYSSLVNGINTVNNTNVKLSSDEYDEFIESSDKLGELFPELITGLDDEGHYILNLGDNAESSTEKINQLIEAQQQLVAEQSKESLKTTFAGIEEETRGGSDVIDSAEAQIDKIEQLDSFINMFVTDLQGAAGQLGSKTLSLPDTYDGADSEILMNNIRDIVNESLGTDLKTEYNDLTHEYFLDLNDITQEQYEQVINSLYLNSDVLKDNIIQQLTVGMSDSEDEINNAYKNELSTIYTALSGEADYKNLSTNGKALADALVANLNFADYKDVISSKYKNDIITFLNEEILKSLYDLSDDDKAKVDEIYANLLAIDEDASLEQNIIAIEDYISQLADILGLDKNQLKIKLGFDTDEDEAELQRIKDRLGYNSNASDSTSGNKNQTINSFVGQLNKEDAKIADSPEFEKAVENQKQKVIDAAQETKQTVEEEMKSLEKDGTVNLTLRPTIDTSLLNEAGWDAGEGTATVFSSTYSNEDGTVAVNFTPIIADPETGEYLGILSPEELQSYAEGVIAGTREDDLNLQIGGEFTGDDAIEQAVNEAENIHELQAQYYLDTEQNIDNVVLSVDDYNAALQEAKNTLETFTYDSFEDAWAALDDPEDDTLKNLKSELEDLAEAGRLTEETFNKLDGSDTFLNQIGLSASEAIIKINELQSSSSQLSSLSKEISAMSDALATKSSDGFIDADTLSGFDATVRGLDSWKDFEELLGSSESSMADCQEAANALATEYVNSNNFLSQLNDTNADYYTTQLKAMGVDNAEEVVKEALRNQNEALAASEEFVAKKKEETGNASYELTNATGDEINAFAEETNMAEGTSTALMQLALKKAYANNATLDFSGDITNMASYVKAINGTCYALSTLASAKDGDIKDTSALEKIRAQAQAEIDSAMNKTSTNISINPSGVSSSSSSGSGSGDSGSSSSDSKTSIDWIQRRIETLNTAIDKLKANLENAFSVKKKNSIIDSEIKKSKELLDTYDKANQKYSSIADNYAKQNSKVLTDSMIKKIQSGAYDINEYSSETAEIINTYKDYYDNAQSAAQSYEETITEIRNLEIEKLQNLQDQADAKAELYETEAESTDSAKKKNKYLQKEITQLGKSYQYQVEIALKTNDITEASKLRLEYEQKILSVMEEQLQNIQDQADNTVSYNEAKIENTSSSTKKKELYTSNASEYGKAVTKTQNYLKSTDFKNDIKTATKSEMQSSYGEGTANYKSIDKLLSKSKVNKKIISKIQSYLKNGERIPDKLLAKCEGTNFYKKLVNYNKAYDENYDENKKSLTDTANLQIEEDIKNQRESKISAIQVDVDDANAKSTLYETQASNKTSYKDKNKLIDKQTEQLKTYYKGLIKIAKLEGDVTEQKRLQAEWEAKQVEQEKTKFDNISSAYSNKIGLLENQMTSIDNQIAEIEARGMTVSASYYKSQQKINNQELKKYQAEKVALEEQLKNIKEGTDEWYAAKDAIQTCEDNISKCTQKTYELNDAITQLKLDSFDKVSEKIGRVIDEQEFLQSLFEHENTTDEDTGEFTEAGLAKLGSTSAQYYLAKQRAENDKALLTDLQNVKEKGLQSDGTYKLGDYVFNSLDELQDKIDETYTTWQDDIKETYSYESDIVDLMKEKYQSELDLVKELIDQKKNELSISKD